MRRLLPLFGAVLLVLVAVIPAGAAPITIAAVGDIACSPTSSAFKAGNGTATLCRHKYVAQQIQTRQVQAFLPLGDIQYEVGSYPHFLASYDLWFRPIKAKSYPVPGNHEYRTTGAAGYYQYYPDQPKWYDYQLNGWHFLAINSNCSQVGGCAVGTAQHTWVKSTATANTAQCQIAYWHHPRYNSGEHGGASNMTAIWNALYRDKTEIVLAGHEHAYSRWAKLNGQGVAAADGIRQFIVGTGGKSLYRTSTTDARIVDREFVYGALFLTLDTDSYSWQFVSENGTVLDAGSDTCA